MKRHLIWIVPVCIIAACVSLFLLMFRRESIEQEVMDPQEDRFEAAKIFLKSRGFEVQELDSFDEIEANDEGAVVFALGRDANLDLVWAMDEIEEESYHLILVHHLESEPVIAFKQPAKEFFLNELPENLEDSFSTVTLDGEKGLASFPPYPDVHLKLSGSTFYQKGNEHGFAIHIEHGSSKVTALSDTSFMSNNGLAEADNAAYLLLLSTSLSVRPQIYFLADDIETPNLWSLIWQRGKSVVLSALVCLLIFLWVHVPRFGPVLPEPPLGRRSIQEHILATAKFHWRMGHRSLLIEVVRYGVLERIRRLRPGWVGLEPSLLHKELAELTTLKEDQVALALSSTPPAEAFLSVLAYLQTIRRSL